MRANRRLAVALLQGADRGSRRNRAVAKRVRRLSFGRLFLLTVWTVGGGGAEQAPDYRESPLELHQWLRQRFAAGRDVGAVVRRVIQQTGDHSFDSFLTLSPPRCWAVAL